MIVEYKIENDEPVIYLFYREKDNPETRICKKITNFKPYFYVLSDSVLFENVKDVKADMEFLEIEDKSRFFKFLEERIIGIEKCSIKSIYGEELKKITVKYPSDVAILRKYFRTTYEADIPFATRFSIDNIEDIPETLRVLYMDIEVDDRKGMPKNYEEAVLGICMLDGFTGEYHQFVLSDNKNKYEEEMLLDFVYKLREINPDVIVGWNVSFDIGYLIHRMKKLGLNPELLSPIFTVDDNRNKIYGVAVFDLLEGYRKLVLKEQESYKLDDIGVKEGLGGKVEHDMSIYEMWESYPEKFKEYNRRDVELIYMIDKKRQIIDTFNQMRKITHCSLEDTLHFSRSIDCLLLYKCKGICVLPTKSQREGSGFKGGNVLEPIKGIYSNVITLDLVRAYPSAIMSCNISPETFDENGDIVIGNGYRFNSLKKGIIPQLFAELIKYRSEKKKLMEEAKKKYGTNSPEYKIYYAQQFAFKALINSIYGYLGYSRSRVFDERLASSVTFVVRELILFIIEILKERNYEVIYGDTDSVFVIVKTNEHEKEGKMLEEYINGRLKEFAESMNVKNSHFKIQFDKVFKKILFVEQKGTKEGAKKKYAGLQIYKNEKGEVVTDMYIAGFECVRSDRSKLAKEIQKTVIYFILEGKDKYYIRSYIRNIVENIKQNVYSIDEIGIPAALGKRVEDYKVKTLNLKAFINSQRYFKDIMRSYKAKLVYVKSGSGRIPLVVPHNKLPQGMRIDHDIMIQKTVKENVESLINLIHLPWEDIVGKGMTAKLYEFF